MKQSTCTVQNSCKIYTVSVTGLYNTVPKHLYTMICGKSNHKAKWNKLMYIIQMFMISGMCLTLAVLKHPCKGDPPKMFSSCLHSHVYFALLHIILLNFSAYRSTSLQAGTLSTELLISPFNQKQLPQKCLFFLFQFEKNII